MGMLRIHKLINSKQKLGIWTEKSWTEPVAEDLLLQPDVVDASLGPDGACAVPLGGSEIACDSVVNCYTVLLIVLSIQVARF